MKVFIVIPAHNEESDIAKVIHGLKNRCVDYNIIVVDDGSRDNTSKIASENNVLVLRHAINLGKGAALKTGCDGAISFGAEAIIAMDADGQHKPEDIPKFIKEIESGKDIVFSRRTFDKNMPMPMSLGNIFLTKVISFLFNIKLSDSQSGFRAFTKEAYRKIRWGSSDYSVETEMILRAGQQKLKYGEIAIDTIYLDRYKGTTIFDGITIFFKILKWKIFKY